MAENENIAPVAPQQPESSSGQPAATTNSAPTPKTTVVKPTVVQSTVKKGRKLSPRLVVLGCIGFIVIFILGLFGALYVGLQNPGKLANIGIAPADAKSLLMIIAGVFFGVIFLFGFGFLAINTYRLIRNKGGSKTKYFAGMFVGFILLGIAVGLGAVAITKVQGIKVDSFANTDELVIPYLITTSTNGGKDEYVYAKAPGIYVIAPVDIAYQINEEVVNLKYKNVAGNNPPLSMVLDCGNGSRQVATQTVNGGGYIRGDNPFFDNTCLYTKKGTYAPKITFTYRDPVKQQNQTFTLDAGSITIIAQTNVTVDGKNVGTNSGNSEMVVGDAPVRVQIDAKNIFSELGISDNDIIWDMETDGTPDKENKVTFGYNYLEPQLYVVSYRFPNSAGTLANLRYRFYLRVNQSDTPRCTVSAEGEGNTYKFTTMWPGGDDVTEEINNYRREIYDIDRETTVQSLTSRDDTLEHTFAQQGNYTARLRFTTIDNAQGLCESDVVHAGAAAYNINYKIFYQKPGTKEFTQFPSTGVISQQGDSVIIDTLPITVRVEITDITPAPQSSTVVMKLNNKVMSKLNNTAHDTFEATITEKGDQKMVITLEDEQGTKVEKEIGISLNQSIIQGVLKADNYAGTEPLKVTLDASTTKLNDDTDEILYFTWDFGDGETAKNVSQGRISHIYTIKGDTVSYRPSVTVTTKKGYSATFGIDKPISVLKKVSTVIIKLPNNPLGSTKVGTPVRMDMESDGRIKRITWDFGDGNTFYCTDRSCSTTQHTYATAGDYTISIRVEYEDREEAASTIHIRAQ